MEILQKLIHTLTHKETAAIPMKELDDKDDPLMKFEETVTQEEKNAKSYADWSDERVGEFCSAFCKSISMSFDNLQNASTKAAVLLTGSMYRFNKESLHIEQDFLPVVLEQRKHQVSLNINLINKNYEAKESKASFEAEISEVEENSIKEITLFGSIFDDYKNLAQLYRKLAVEFPSKDGKEAADLTMAFGIMIENTLQMRAAEYGTTLSGLMKNGKIYSNNQYKLDINIQSPELNMMPSAKRKLN